MPAKSKEIESDGFSAEARAAMKERAAELRAEGKDRAKKADGLQAVLDRIAQMAPDDRMLAERVHVIVTTTAPQLSPKTWYGMPAYADADGQVVVFFQDAGKFKYRYSTSVSRRQPTSTTATSGRCRTPSRGGAPRWRRRSSSWSRRPAAELRGQLHGLPAHETIRPCRPTSVG